MESLEERLTRPEGLATRLRALRVQAGLSGKDLAAANGWEQSKVSRIENGKQMPSAGDIGAWASACGAGGPDVTGDLLRMREDARVFHATFRSRMSHGQAAVQKDYNELVRDSRLIRHFETVYVPGLLQVPAYARRVLTEMISLHQLPVDDVDAAVEARMERQPMLYDRGKRFEFLLAEPVLQWLLVPPAVMRDQLDRLQTVIGLERIRFGILPVRRVLATAPQNSFQIYEGKETRAITETFLGEDCNLDAEQAEQYVRAMELMWAEAVEGDAARELIVSAARALPSA